MAVQYIDLCYSNFVNMVRRCFLVLLLFAVPFQAVVGAAAPHCAIKQTPTEESTWSVHASGLVPQAGHTGAADSACPDCASAASADPGAERNAAGTCNLFSGCIVAATAITSPPIAVLVPDTTLRVSSLVESPFASQVGDEHFRPPRTVVA